MALMNTTARKIVGMLLSGLPFLIIVFPVLHYALRRALWRRRERRGMKGLGFCPSAAAPATALLILPVFYRSSAIHTLVARQHAQVEENDQGDPDSPHRHLHRQLRKIRQGEPVETLVLRR